MLLLSNEYFVGRLSVPNLPDLTVGPTISAGLSFYSDRYVPKFLDLVLGEDLAAEFLLEIAEAYPLAKWTDLRDALMDDDTHISPMANYVYFYFMRDQFPALGQTGAQFPEGTGAVVGYHTERLADAWNDMTDLLEDFWDWMDTNKADYTDWTGAYDFGHINTIGI